MSVLSRRDESGSIIVTMTIIGILGLLGAAVVARAISAQDSARSAQEFSAALGPADAGVSDALLRLDAIGTGTPNTSFCVGVSGCDVASLSGSAFTQYSWSYNSASDKITVLSKGLENGRAHGVRAELTRAGLFPFAIFGQDLLEFKGASGSNIVAVDKFGNVVTTPDADAGTNGTIDCTSGGGGESNGSYTGGGVDPDCNQPKDLSDDGSYDPTAPIASPNCSLEPRTIPLTPCIPATGTSCPANAAGVLANPLQPGRYLCRQNVTFPAGPVSVISDLSSNGGVFELFVIPTPTSGPLNVTFTGACVNVAVSSVCTNETTDPVDGDPSKLRVYVAGSGVIDPGTGANAIEYNGILYAPQSSMHSAGCKVRWRGALVFKEAKCSGGPNMSIRYDQRVAGLRDATWQLENYYEVPSSEVVISP